MCISHRLILFIGILVFTACSFSERADVDSLENYELQQRIDEELGELSNLVNSFRYTQADSLVTALFRDVKNYGNANQIVKVASELAFVKLNKGELDEAIGVFDQVTPEQLQQSTQRNQHEFNIRKASVLNERGEFSAALEILEPLKVQFEAEETLNEMRLLLISTYATVMQNLYQYEKAIDAFQQVLQIGRQVGTSERNIAIIHNNIGFLLHELERFEESLEELRISYRINVENNIVPGINQNLNNYANSLNGLGRFQEAIDTLRSAIRYSKESGGSISLIRNYYNLGNVLANNNQRNEAEEYFNLGLELSRQVNLPFGIMFNSSGLASLYLEQGKYSEAMEAAQGSLLWSERLGSLEIQSNSLDIISQVYESRGDFSRALASLKQFKAISDSLQKLQNQQAIEEVRSAFSLNIINTENELLRQQIAFGKDRDKARNTFILILIAVALVILGLLVLIIRQNRLIERKNEYLAELLDSRENLINIIVHDLRSPLSSLISSLEIIEELYAQPNEEFVEIFEVAQLSAEKLRLMVNGLLDVRSIQNEDISKTLQSYDINHVTQSAIDNFKSAAAKKNIEIKTDFHPITAQTNGEYYNRIVENLLSNALKYSFKNTIVHIDLYADGTDKWVLKVSDQGQGFSERDKKDAFQMFKKLSARPTDDEPSSGLGLYTIKLLVDRLGGSISLESEQGKGSTFTCIFPINYVG